eukprot:TRINITY_DN27222_c0_g1_i1.p1 TRINITY_DN27222_c0_g1~~TRINITY_DN27222_c0_g1_i1.p1  ORF type:complete len:105 (+),score=19.01 TRINITY_DN27222_c0_g1_i1:183-497(+)
MSNIKLTLHLYDFRGGRDRGYFRRQQSETLSILPNSTVGDLKSQIMSHTGIEGSWGKVGSVTNNWGELSGLKEFHDTSATLSSAGIHDGDIIVAEIPLPRGMCD